MRSFPDYTLNRNVPDGVFIIAEIEYCSGELVDTYFVGAGENIYLVSDWANDIPTRIGWGRLFRDTGLSPQMVSGAYDSWKARGEQ